MIHNVTGERCPIVGHVSADAVTVKVPECISLNETFTFLSADFDDITSCAAIATKLNTVGAEIFARISPRLPRIYKSKGKQPVVVQLTKQN